MGGWRRTFFYFRVLLLVALFAGAYVLYDWSERQDPRFFKFVGTAPGQLLARLFKWQGLPMGQVVKEKPAADMTPQELAVKAEVEAGMASLAPSHRIELADGQMMTGTIVSETPDKILFRQSYGDSASIETTYPRSRIKNIEKNVVRLPPVTYRDIRFKMEFPEQAFYKMKPYSFMTDESYLRVVHAVSDLQLLYKQFRDTFGSLIEQGRIRDDLQVLFFSEERRFRRYQRELAPGLDYSVGFYAPTLDRLVVFNHEQAEDMQAIQKAVETRAESYRQQAKGSDQERRVNEWKRSTDRQLAGFAEEQNRATLRHEGTHQLAFTLGVHSWHRAESEWLIEGLATYCESSPPGQVDTSRSGALRRGMDRGALFPLRDLTRMRVGEFGKLGGEDRIALAYSQSWALVLFLMQRDNQARFFNYMRHLRDEANIDDVRQTDPFDLLARFEGLSPDELERKWTDFVRKLPE
jgi:hypothetical protein